MNGDAMKGKIKEILKLTRIEHSIMLVLAVLAAELLAGAHQLSIVTVILSLLPPIFIGASAFIINDYYDIKADKANGILDRPLVSGAISKSEAVALYILCLAIGIALSALLDIAAFVIVLAFAALSLLYSHWLKKALILGNAYVAFSMVIPFIYGAYVVAHGVNQNLLIICAIIFLAGMAREIHGTIRDYHGDSIERKVKNIVYYIGYTWSSISALALYLVAVAFTITLLYNPPFAGNLVYILPIGITDISLLYLSFSYVVVRPWKSGTGKKGKELFYISRNLSLGVMALSILSFLLSAFVRIPI